MASANDPLEILSRLERFPLTKTHYKIAVVLCIAFFFELADLNTFGCAAPALMKYWHISVATVGQITSMSFLGMFIGALVGGYIADLFGRRVSFLGAVVLYSVFSFSNAFANNVNALLATRFLTGIFLSMMTVIAFTILSEMYPAHVRGKYQAMALGIGLFGIPVITFYARWVVGIGPDGWRWIFIGGALGIIAFIFGIFWLKESPRYYLRKGLTEKARNYISVLMKEANLTEADLEAAGSATMRKPAEQVGKSPRGSVGNLIELFSSRSQTSRTLMICVLWLFGTIAFYGFYTWVPTLLYGLGISVTKSLLFTSLMMIGAPFGALAAIPFTDKFGRKKMIAITYFVSTVVGVIFGLMRSPVGLVIMGFIVAFVFQHGVSYIYAYTPEQFTTSIRNTGCGLSYGIGRLATVFSPLLIAALFTGFGKNGFLAVFIFVALCYLIGSMIAQFWGTDTRKTLEEITGDFGADSSVAI